MQTVLVSSLEKVFLQKKTELLPYKAGSCFQNEKFSFQLALRYDEIEKGSIAKVSVKVESDLLPYISLCTVENVPSLFPAHLDADEQYITKEPGLFPDALMPYEGEWKLVCSQWRSLWVMVDVPEDLSAGDYTISLTVSWEDGSIAGSENFALTVLPHVLPQNIMPCTEWFHYDCLASHYGVEIWSDEYERILKNYLKNYTEYGMNMLMVSLFTPPLDTEIGTYRPTAQLLDIVYEKGQYTFDFARLDAFMDMAEEMGILYFEMPHLFTQWGAHCAPKIEAVVDGEKKRIFGWDVEATSVAYHEFLAAMLPALTAHLKEKARLSKCYFHVSDEPEEKDLACYQSAMDMVKPYLQDCHMIDALSAYPFYEQGLVKTPVCANDYIEPFLEHEVDDLWTYYCCAQYKHVANRFMAMPSYRNRILGWQLYRYGIKGFLHWGYNFWYTQLSKKEIDPFAVTDSGQAFPSGDAFLVYPAKDGKPILSIREVVFLESFQDMRALNLLEKFVPEGEVISLMEKAAGEKITFSNFPQSEKTLLYMREAINSEIKKYL